VRDTLATALLPGIRDATGEPCEAIGPQRGVVFVDGAADEAGTVSGEATLAGLSAADTIKILLGTLERSPVLGVTVIGRGTQTNA